MNRLIKEQILNPFLLTRLLGKQQERGIQLVVDHTLGEKIWMFVLMEELVQVGLIDS